MRVVTFPVARATGERRAVGGSGLCDGWATALARVGNGLVCYGFGPVVGTAWSGYGLSPPTRDRPIAVGSGLPVPDEGSQVFCLIRLVSSAIWL
jgi:hypothetical protein